MRADVQRNRALVRQAVAARGRYRDRRCWASLATLAADTGLCTQTIRRHLRALERDGVIERDRNPVGARTCCWRFAHGERRTPKCHPTLESRKALNGSTGTFKERRFLRASAPPRRRCTLAEDLTLFPKPQPPERPLHAGDVMAVVASYVTSTGAILLRRERGILARQAKELLTDGADPTLVARSCVVAWRRGEPHNAWRICSDLMRVEAGALISRDAYWRELNTLSRADVLATFDRIRQERLARRELNRERASQ